jgi:hypothetical protein
MKIGNWCRKLSATLVAGGLMVPVAAHAAGLNTNLVVNAGFENVDLAVTGDYNGPKILDWTVPVAGFAYSHNGSSSNAGVVPNYANGVLASGGNWYFTTNNADASVGDSGGDIDTLAEAINQSIDVSTGPSASAIAGGATYSLSAFFNTYTNHSDGGIVHVDFLDAANGNLGSANIQPPGNVQQWTQISTSGAVPTGTTAVRISAYGFTGQSGGADGYIDNVDFRIIPEPSSIALAGLGIATAALRRRRDDS